MKFKSGMEMSAGWFCYLSRVAPCMVVTGGGTGNFALRFRNCECSSPWGPSWYFLKGEPAPGVQVKGVLGRGGQNGLVEVSL